MNSSKFLRTPFLQNTSGRLLLFRVNRVSDHYARSIYVKVFLWIIVPWMLVPSKILRISKNTWNISKFIRKYLLQVRCRSSAWNFTCSFILQDFFYTSGTRIFRNTWECYSNFFDCNVSRIYSLLFFFLFFFKNKMPCTFFLGTVYF